MVNPGFYVPPNPFLCSVTLNVCFIASDTKYCIYLLPVIDGEACPAMMLTLAC